MNIRSHLMRMMENKYGLDLVLEDADISVLRRYLSPIESLFGEDYEAFCQALFNVYRTQIAVYKRNIIDEPKGMLKMVKSIVKDLSDRDGDVSVKEMQKAVEGDRRLRGVRFRVMLDLCIQYTDSEGVFQAPEQEMPLDMCDWISKCVSRREFVVNDWEVLRDLSFEQYCASYMVHSQADFNWVEALFSTPKIKEIYDRESAAASTDNIYALCGDFESFRSLLLEDIVALEEVGKKEVAPMLEKGYRHYQECIRILVEQTAKADVQSLPKVEKPFAHLPQYEGLSDGSFAQDVIRVSESKPVLVMFTDTWCSACTGLQLGLSEVKKQFPGLAIIKAYTDENKAVMDDLDVKDAPTLVLYQKGRPAEDQLEGLKSENEIMQYLVKEIAAEDIAKIKEQNVKVAPEQAVAPVEQQAVRPQATIASQFSLVSMFLSPVAPVVVGAAAIALASACMSGSDNTEEGGWSLC